MSNKAMQDYILKWNDTLKNCAYAGEIYIGVEELHKIAQEFISTRNYLGKGHTGTALLVLAVNCAYHYYDDEGFWKHFCALIKRDNNPYEHESLGQTIEKCLKSYGLMRTERAGPFRYVGAILEQCGLSRRYIPGFANIFKVLLDNKGHQKLLNMSHFHFKRIIEGMHCPKYLKSFLVDASGWQFTLQVCHLIQQYREGEITLGELNELPGFQPDFWTEFLSHLQVKTIRGQISKYAYFKPRLVFLTGENHIGLQFPFLEFTKIIEKPSVARAWKYPVTILNDDRLWSDEYSGQVIDKGHSVTWNVKGWLPDGLPVLFDIKNGFIQRNESINPGRYYLLAPRGYGFNCTDKEHLGPVHCPGSWNYQAYRVRLGRDDHIHGYGLDIDNLEKLMTIQWVNPEENMMNYAEDDYFDVFTGSLPDIETTNFHYIESNAVGLFCDLGEGAVRLRNRQAIREFLTEAQRRAPVRGRLWLSNFSRGWINPGQRNITGLQFCLIPRCQITYTKRLYGYSEEVILQIDGCSHCRVVFESCTSLDREGGRWSVPASKNPAVGTLMCGDVSAGLRVPVYRAGIYDINRRRVNFICISELHNETDFILTGVPGTGAHLVTENCDSIDINVVFNGHGRAVINSSDLLRLAGNLNAPVHEIFLESDGIKVNTGTVLIDLEWIQKNLYRGEAFEVRLSNARNLGVMLNLITKICRSPLPDIKMNRLPGYSHEFDEWVNTVLGCAAVFDGTHVIIGDAVFDWNKKIENPKIKDLLNSYMRLKAGHFSDESILKEPGVLPGVVRWHKALDGLLRMNTREGMMDDLKQWSDDVLRQRGALKSRIAGRPGGNTLTRAWRSYHRKETLKTLELINNITDVTELVSDLKILLHTFVLLRTARLRSAVRMARSAVLFTDMAMVYDLLRFLISGLSDRNIPKPDVETGLEIALALPLRSEDYDYIKMATAPDVFGDDIIKFHHDNGDWLLLYTLLSFSKPGESRTNLSIKLLNMEERIPASPEKLDIINRITYYAGGN